MCVSLLLYFHSIFAMVCAWVPWKSQWLEFIAHFSWLYFNFYSLSVYCIHYFTSGRLALIRIKSTPSLYNWLFVGETLNDFLFEKKFSSWLFENAYESSISILSRIICAHMFYLLYSYCFFLAHFRRFSVVVCLMMVFYSVAFLIKTRPLMLWAYEICYFR